MDAGASLDESLSLEEKLAKIDEMVRLSQQKHDEMVGKAPAGKVMAPFDPADATMCEGCQ